MRDTQNFICASTFAANELERLDIAPIRISLGVDHTQFGSEQVINEHADQFHGRAHTVTFVGRLSPEKNPLLAVSAMREICQTRHDIQLVVIGDGPLKEELMDHARDLPITFLGHITDREYIASILRNSFCTLNLGDRETFSLSTLESLASGTPAIVASSGASREILAAGCGVATSLTPICVSLAIESMLLSDRDVARKACRDRAGQFTWEKAAKSLLHSYGNSELVSNLENQLHNIEFGRVA